MGFRNWVLSALFVSLPFANTVFAAEPQVEVVAGQELLLYPKSNITKSAFASSLSQQISVFGNSNKVKFSQTSKIAVASYGSSGSSFRQVSKTDLESACSKLRNAQVGCEINYVLKTFKTPNDPGYASLIGLEKIAASSAWEATTGSNSIKVAVVDSGVDYSHPDLAANINLNSSEIPGNGIDDDSNGLVDDYYGYDFSGSGDSNPMDENGHGTHVAGTIGAVGNNSAGVVGVNWSVGLLAVKVLSANGSGLTSDVIEGIDYAISRGARVINLSIGGPGFSQPFYEAIERANNSGVLVVAAAGNENQNNDGETKSYPASFNLPNIISVAATSSSDQRASFSNYGASSVHLAAPGVQILSTVPGASYDEYSGTSMATPHVAGAAALILSLNSGFGALQVKDLILNNVDVVSSLNGLVATSGRLNIAKALRAAGGSNPIPDPQPTPPPTDDGSGGGGSPDPGLEDPGSEYQLTSLDVAYTVKNKKASIVIAALDQELYGLEDVAITLTCANKKVGRKITNEEGEVRFSYKLRSSAAKCLVTALDIDNGITKKKSFKVKVPTRNRRR